MRRTLLRVGVKYKMKIIIIKHTIYEERKTPTCDTQDKCHPTMSVRQFVETLNKHNSYFCGRGNGDIEVKK